MLCPCYCAALLPGQITSWRLCLLLCCSTTLVCMRQAVSSVLLTSDAVARQDKHTSAAVSGIGHQSSLTMVSAWVSAWQVHWYSRLHVTYGLRPVLPVHDRTLLLVSSTESGFREVRGGVVGAPTCQFAVAHTASCSFAFRPPTC